MNKMTSATMTASPAPARPIRGADCAGFNASDLNAGFGADRKPLVKRAAAPGDEPVRTPKRLADYLTANADALSRAAGGQVDVGRAIRLCTRILEEPRGADLLRCTLRSFASAFCDSLATGIWPDAGRGYFVATGDRAVFLLGYHGMIELATKAGIFVKAYNVFKGDKFKWVAGGDERIVHLPNVEIRRSEENFLCSYCVSIIDGRHVYDVMLKSEIDAVRDRSGEFNDVWATDYLEMARKTVVRRASKYWPASRGWQYTPGEVAASR